MSKVMKRMMGEEIAAELAPYDSFVVIGLEGLDVESSNTLRARLANEDGRLRVVHNRITQHVFSGQGREGLGELLRGSSAIAYGGEGAVVLSRLLVDWEKERKNITVKGGYVDGETVGEDGVRRLATIPDRDTLRAQILAGIQGPMTNLARCFNGVGQGLVTVLKAIADKKQEAGE